jgi:hypothetical protein
MLPFAVMGGSDGLSRLPACLAAARGLCVMGLVGGILGARNAAVRPRTRSPIAVTVPPTVPGLLLAKSQRPRPREGWPVACGLSPESYGQRDDRRPGWCRAGLAAASCSPCLPSPASLSSLVCLPACLLACLLACFCSSPAALPSAPRFTVHARVPIL